jgi:N6-adenosine-specific RNA methylase IME4
MCGPGRRGLGGLAIGRGHWARPALRQHLPAGLFGKLSDVGASNIANALEVMAAWGFEFKSSAAWVKWDGEKLQKGMGLVFRNSHEVLLYGTRGNNMPGPQHQPSSALMYPRGKHSAKPPEIRKEIEKMYPDFDARKRLELFARDQVRGWTGYGFEVDSPAA